MGLIGKINIKNRVKGKKGKIRILAAKSPYAVSQIIIPTFFCASYRIEFILGHKLPEER
jgi:hypothetical protein